MGCIRVFAVVTMWGQTSTNTLTRISYFVFAIVYVVVNWADHHFHTSVTFNKLFHLYIYLFYWVRD